MSSVLTVLEATDRIMHHDVLEITLCTKQG
jgi:hypothetical protein